MHAELIARLRGRWRGFKGHLRWLFPKCRKCRDTGWVTHEIWVGARGYRAGEFCECRRISALEASDD